MHKTRLQFQAIQVSMVWLVAPSCLEVCDTHADDGAGGSGTWKKTSLKRRPVAPVPTAAPRGDLSATLKQR